MLLLFEEKGEFLPVNNNTHNIKYYIFNFAKLSEENYLDNFLI
jgi:hypothetical protein